MKRWWIALPAAATLALAVLAAVHSPASDTGADRMELPGGSRGAVPFPHHRHQEVLGDCEVCHSLFPREAGGIEALKSEGRLEPKQVMNRLCVACHRERERSKRASGPTLCSRCHARS